MQMCCSILCVRPYKTEKTLKKLLLQVMTSDKVKIF